MPRSINYFLLFSLILSIFAFAGPSMALDLEKAKISFLAGDYTSTVEQGEKILSAANEDSPGLDELYYIMGLSYLKQGRYLRACDIFEIILGEFKGSKFTDEARMGLGDSFFLRGDYTAAQANYQQILSESPKTTVRPLVYYRLSQCAAKTGDAQTAADYLNKLRLDAPMNLEVRSDGAPPLTSAQNVSAAGISGTPAKILYTVQVGNFSKKKNAENLTKKLSDKGFSAYMEESNIRGKLSYCVRVGKTSDRQEARELEKKLARSGYPTKIFP